MTPRPDQHDPAHERWLDTGASWLLGAVPEEEAAAFEQHLAGCARCAEVLTELRAAVETLPLVADVHAPPAALGERIMSVVHAEAAERQRIDAAAGAPVHRRAENPEPIGPPSRDPARSRPGMPWRLRLRLGPARALAVAIVLVAIGGVAGGLAMRGDGPGARSVTATLDRKQAPEASGRLVMRGGHATLELADMPAPAEGRVYQVWVVRTDRTVPEATQALFTPASDGRSAVDVPVPVSEVDRVMVTQEPDGGSSAPTLDPVVQVAVDAS